MYLYNFRSQMFHPSPPPPLILEILINFFFSNNFVKSLLVDNSKLLQKLYLVNV